jgi:hypothetical protein
MFGTLRIAESAGICLSLRRTSVAMVSRRFPAMTMAARGNASAAAASAATTTAAAAAFAQSVCRVGK